LLVCIRARRPRCCNRPAALQQQHLLVFPVPALRCRRTRTCSSAIDRPTALSWRLLGPAPSLLCSYPTVPACLHCVPSSPFIFKLGASHRRVRVRFFAALGSRRRSPAGSGARGRGASSRRQGGRPAGRRCKHTGLQTTRTLPGPRHGEEARSSEKQQSFAFALHTKLAATSSCLGICPLSDASFLMFCSHTPCMQSMS
jgi:hypothetical protein